MLKSHKLKQFINDSSKLILLIFISLAIFIGLSIQECQLGSSSNNSSNDYDYNYDNNYDYSYDNSNDYDYSNNYIIDCYKIKF